MKINKVKMFKRLMEAARKLKQKNKFVATIASNTLWRRYFMASYHRNRIYAMQRRKESVSFFSKNADRVNKIANMLADEQSKKEYLGMIKYRQTDRKKDFPISTWGEPQYFIKEVTFGKDEVFVDCGAYNGDTIDEFLKHCFEYKQIVAFEPDTKNLEALSEKYGHNSKITLINAGAYDKDGKVYFFEDKRRSDNSKIMDNNIEGNEQENCTSISVKAIDNLGLEKVTFIKMDIEGAEMNALKGAEKTILRDKPKLAICIYHSNEDMIRIAEYIHGLVSQYRLYVRQHYIYPHSAETVLYALVP